MMDMHKRYYMAYGSNLSVEQMARRCPDAKIVGKAVIPDWKLVFKYHADIVPCEGAQVQVLIWEISSEDEKSLDLYEGYPHYYTKRMMNVAMTDLNGEHPQEVEAMVYVMTDAHFKLAMPSKGYYDVLAKGYREFGFDDRFLRFALLEAIDEQENRTGKEAASYDFS